MDQDIARKLADLNTQFYAQQADSFSATRHSGWPGWRRVGEHLAALNAGAGAGAGADMGAGAGVGAGAGASRVDSARCVSAESALERKQGSLCLTKPVWVLDLACGNLRFERFLGDAHADGGWRFCAVDNCVPLAEAGAMPQDVEFHELDVVGSLLDGSLDMRMDGAADASQPQAFDAAVSFGFLHHVPGFGRRVEVLRAMAQAVRPGGLVAVSLWRFMSNPGLAAKAQATTADALAQLPWLDAAQLEAGDYLLGWQDRPGVFRYCHHFEAGEIDALLAAVPDVELVDRFRADGRTDDLNEYLVLRVR